MPFELISEEEMASKSRKERTKITGEKKIKIIDKEIIIKEPKDDKQEKTEIKLEKTEIKLEKDKTKEEKDKTVKEDKGNIIVKKVYFPTDLYSKNQAEFKKILANHGLSWFKPMYKMYVNKAGVKISTGAYLSGDKNKKVLCIYEGSKMPMTAIIKIIGTGENFLVDMNSFCTRVGCSIEDKDESYSDKVASTLKERGELYVEGMEDTIAEKIKKGDISVEDKIKSMIEDRLQKYVDAYRDSLDKKQVSIETFKFFKRKDIEKDIKWALENGLINLQNN